MQNTSGATTGTWQVKLLVVWFGLDGLLYLGALLTMVQTMTDTAYRPYAYAFTIALVASWATRMAYGIWLELRRVHQAEHEKAHKVDEILQQHGLSPDQSEAVRQALKSLV